VILANYPTNPPSVMGGLKGETLPQIGRIMKFRLTVRDNRAGGGGVATGGDGCDGGFNNFFTVNAIDGTGPFVLNAPNGGENWMGGSSQLITWNPAGTNAAPISVANVKISLSVDGGLTYPTVLIASTPNDGSETITLPGTSSTTARVKVEAIGNIFFDISNNNFTITVPVSTFDFTTPAAVSVACNNPTTADILLGTTSSNGYNTPITLSADNPNITFVTNPVTPGSSSVVRLNNVNILSAGTYNVTVTGVSGAITKTKMITYIILPGAGPVISVHPASQNACAGTNPVFSVTSATAISYQWQLSTDGGTNFSAINGATASSYTVNNVSTAQNSYQYRCIVTGQCNTSTSNAGILTVLTAPAINGHPQNATLCTSSNNTFNVTASGSNLNYQWQLSTNGGANFNDIAAANGTSYAVNGVVAGMNTNQYRVVVSGSCTPSATSNAAVLTVISPVTVTAQPTDIVICETGNVNFTVAGSGAGVLYQWQVSTDGGNTYANINGAIAATLNVNAVAAGMNNNRYRALLYNATCPAPASSNGARLTVNARPAVTLTASPYTRLFPGLTTTLTANIIPSAAGFTLTWYQSAAAIPITGLAGSTRVVDVTGLGDYRVDIVNNVTGCNNQSNVLRISDSASNKLFVYPSPNDGQFTVAYYNAGGSSTQRTISIYNSNGKQVYNAKFPVNGPYQLVPVNLKPAARGIYMIVVGDAAGKKLAEGKLAVYY
jgi:hypothetical protein